MSKTIMARFLAKVDYAGPVHPVLRTACHVWTAGLGGKGYGQLGKGRAGAGKVYAHRLSYEMYIGPIPDGMHVLHRCDNMRCVNPDHLFLGTNQDNVTDKVTKGRQVSGDAHHSSQLSDAEVAEMRLLRSKGWKLSQLVERFNCCKQHVSDICCGKKRKSSCTSLQPDVVSE